MLRGLATFIRQLSLFDAPDPRKDALARAKARRP